MISLLIARRYLRASRRESQVGVVAGAALLGLGLGVAALVVALALLAGFQAHLKGRLLEDTPHLVVSPAGRGDFRADEGVARTLAGLPDVVGVTPVARGRVWLSLRGHAVPTEAVGREGLPGLQLDLSQASSLGAFPGDEVTVVSSRTRLSPLGPVPIVVSLRLRELVPSSTGRRAPEAALPLEAARRLFALPEGGATGYELRLRNPDRAAETGRLVAARLGPQVATRTWEELNRALVLALRLERIVLFATISLIVLVAGLNLAATSAVLAATRAGDAAVLSVLGAGPRTVAAIYLWAGGLVGLVGTAVGLLVGTAGAMALDRTGAIPLPAQVYGLAAVPFRVEPLDLLAVGGLSLVWSFLAASLPARAAARRDAAEVLRAA